MELQRRWLLWRDELLRDGVHDPEELLSRLLDMQQSWQETSQDRLEVRTPEQAVRAERKEKEEHLRRAQRPMPSRKDKRRHTKKKRR